MFSRKPNTDEPLLIAGEAHVRRARLRLFWERYAPALATAALALLLFLAGAYVGLWQRIGDPWRLIALIFALYFILRGVISARKLRAPTLSQAARRVEHDSGIAHRPLETLRDKAVLNAREKNGTEGADIWDSHTERARQSLAQIGPAKSRPTLAPMDKYFLRFIAPLALLLAVFVGFGDNGERLRRALSPTWQSALNPAKVTFDAWVDPPDYTGRPPVYFKGKQTVDIPAGSELVARIQGAKDAPRLKLKGAGLLGRKYLKLKRLGPDSFEARTILTEDVTASWRVGTKRREWKLVVREDRAPQVKWQAPPRADKRDRLSFSYGLKDDYGVVKLELHMRLLEADNSAQDQEQTSKTVTVPLAGKSVRETKATDTVIDLTKHIWAGRKVSGHLVAIDGHGLSSHSSTAYFTIPDKIFIEPLAKAVAEHRTLIMAGLSGGQTYAPYPRRTRKQWQDLPRFDDWETNQKLGRAPAQIKRAAALIYALTDAPSGLYEDPAVYMGLKNVLSTLRHSRAIDALSPLPERLWAIAIRAEFGQIGTALEEMREAESNLNEGIARHAPTREIDVLFERYDAAVARYIKELTEEAMKNMADNEGGEGGGGRNTDQIKELLKAIEEANRIGDTEGARIALKKLAQLLENMKIKMTKGGKGDGNGPTSGMSEEMKESLEDLADLLGEERELKDETEQAQNEAEAEAQAGTEAQSGDESGSEGSDNQGSDDGTGHGSSQPKAGQQALSADELAERQGKIADLLDGVKDNLPKGGMMQGDEMSGGSGEDEQAQAGSGEKPDEDGGGGAASPDGKASDKKGGGSGDALRDPETALSDAAKAMREAENALKSGQLDAAAKAQADAIKALREAGQSLAQASGKSRGKQEAGAQGKGQGNPLGQDQDGDNDDFSKADIDQRDNATRSRELMQELRRRAAQQEREQSEREYLERLLKRF